MANRWSIPKAHTLWQLLYLSFDAVEKRCYHAALSIIITGFRMRKKKFLTGRAMRTLLKSLNLQSTIANRFATDGDPSIFRKAVIDGEEVYEYYDGIEEDIRKKYSLVAAAVAAVTEKGMPIPISRDMSVEQVKTFFISVNEIGEILNDIRSSEKNAPYRQGVSKLVDVGVLPQHVFKHGVTKYFDKEKVMQALEDVSTIRKYLRTTETKEGRDTLRVVTVKTNSGRRVYGARY